MFSAPAFLGALLLLQHWALFQDVQQIATDLQVKRAAVYELKVL